MERTLPFDGWFRIATQGLCDQARSYLRGVFESRYQSAIEEETARGFVQEQARHLAALSLGNPLREQKNFKREYLTKYEWETVRFFQSRRWVTLTNIVMMSAVMVLFYSMLHSQSRLVQGSPLVGLGVSLFLCLHIAVVGFAAFWWYPRWQRRRDTLIKRIIVSLYLHEFTAALIFGSVLLVGDSGNHTGVIAWMWVMNWIACCGMIAFFALHKLRIVFKLRKHREYVDVCE